MGQQLYVDFEVMIVKFLKTTPTLTMIHRCALLLLLIFCAALSVSDKEASRQESIFSV